MSWMKSCDNVPHRRSASAHPTAIAGSTSCKPREQYGHGVYADAHRAVQGLRSEIPIHVAERPYEVLAGLRAADSTDQVAAIRSGIEGSG